MSIDWEDGKQYEFDDSDFEMLYKDFAPYGTYERVAIDSVEVKEVGTNGSIAVEFHLKDDDKYKFPRITHWLSFKNDGWRHWHYRKMFQVLGLDDDKAKEAVEQCEKDSKDGTIEAYRTMLGKLVSRHPKVDVVVRPDNRGRTKKDGTPYSEADFADKRVQFTSKGGKKSVAPTQEPEKEELTLDDIPF